MDVSIVITAYNYAHYIERCLSSCLQQTAEHLSYEVIVVDDGSTDDTPDVLRKWSDPRLKTFRVENGGIERASNFGFLKTCGDYVVRVDADDYLLSDYLSTMFEVASRSAHEFFYPNYQVVDAEDRVIDRVQLPAFDVKEVWTRGDFLATGTLFRSSVLNQFDGYKTEIKNSGLENYELIMRMISAGVVGERVPATLFGYRRHSLNLSESKRVQIIGNGRAMFSRMGWGTYSTNSNHPYKLILEER